MPVKTYDAIIVGSGTTGGWAAKELTEKGLNTLVLEAGRPIRPNKDYVETCPHLARGFATWETAIALQSGSSRSSEMWRA
jgi:choline dehydrogenase-like flavoprotein